jgi:hypothetical protein
LANAGNLLKTIGKNGLRMLTQMEPAAKVAGKRFGNTIEKVLDMVESIGRAGCQNVFAEDIHCPETSQGRRYPTLCFHVPG